MLFEADDDGKPLRDIDGMTLLIGLRVTNPYFANFTDAPVAPAPSDLLPPPASGNTPLVPKAD